MPWAFGGGYSFSILLQRRLSLPLFRRLLNLCVYLPGHNRRGGGCFEPTDMVRMNCRPQGPGWCLSCIRHSAVGTGYRFPTKGGAVKWLLFC
jgi:hypothetical protein